MVRALRLLALLALPLSTGCVAPIHYSPNPNVLHEIGVEQGQTLLAEILSRARRPRLAGIEVTTEYYAHGGVNWNYWTGVHANQFQIFYNNVRNVDIYANDRVFVYDVSGRKVAHYDLLNRGDCMTYADLMSSFKNLGGSWPGPSNPAPPPPPPPPPPREEDSTRNLLDDDTDPAQPPPAPPPDEEYYEDEPADGEGRTRNLLDD